MQKFYVIIVLMCMVMFIPATALAQNNQKQMRDSSPSNAQPTLYTQPTSNAKTQATDTNKRVMQSPTSSVPNNINGEKNNSIAEQRRSKVANAVQAMLQVADREQGVGEQIRVVAQSQNQNQNQIEANMETIKNRGRLRKFFFGPDYKNLNKVEDNLADMADKIQQLKDLAGEIDDSTNAAKLQDQIKALEEVKSSWEQEAQEATKGFSLFGWLNKILFKK